MQIPSSPVPSHRPPSASAPVRPAAPVQPPESRPVRNTPLPPEPSKKSSGLMTKIASTAFFAAGMGFAAAIVGMMMLGPMGLLLGALAGGLGGAFLGWTAGSTTVQAKNNAAGHSSSSAQPATQLGLAQQEIPFVEATPALPGAPVPDPYAAEPVQAPEERSF